MEKEIIQYLIKLNKELIIELKKLNFRLKFVDKICEEVIEIKRMLNNLNQPKTITNTEEEIKMLSFITKEEDEFILY